MNVKQPSTYVSPGVIAVNNSQKSPPHGAHFLVRSKIIVEVDVIKGD